MPIDAIVEEKRQCRERKATKETFDVGKGRETIRKSSLFSTTATMTRTEGRGWG